VRRRTAGGKEASVARAKKPRSDEARATWTDEEVIQALTVQGYITRCEYAVPGFSALKPFVDEWSEARVRHAVAKEAPRIARARNHLVRLARRIERIKVEWERGAVDPDRVVPNNRAGHRHVVPLRPRGRR
jgi:hypothetical protein